MPKLMTVTCEFQYVIVVDDDTEYFDAVIKAEEYARDAFFDLTSSDLDIYCVPYGDHIPRGWDIECIPYGGDGNTRTGEYLK